MSLPDEVHIHDEGGYLETYPVERRLWVDGSIRFRHGKDLPLITVSPDKHGAMAEETLLHEIIHACEREAQKAGELEYISEAWVEGVGRRLYWTLVANGMWRWADS